MNANTFQFLRPWPTLNEEDQALLAHIYDHVRQANEPLKRTFLRYETGCSDDDLSRLQGLSLLALENEGFVPTVLALLYLPDAAAELERLDEVVRLAHEHYHPSNLTVAASKVGTPWTPFLQRLARDLYINITPDGDLALSDRNWELKTFEDAFLRRYERQLGPEEVFPSISSPSSELEPLPFTFQLKGLRVERFRALRDIDVALGSLTAFVGPNGVGKSTLLDTLLFIKTATQMSLKRAVQDEGGLERLRTRGSKGPISIALSFQIDHGHGPMQARYDLSFDSLGENPIVEQERLLMDQDVVFEKRRGQTRLFSKSGKTRDVLGPASELGLSGLAKLEEDTMVAGVHRALGQMVLIDRDPLVLSDEAQAFPFGRGRGRQGTKFRQGANLMPLLSKIASDADALSKLATVVGELIPAVQGMEPHLVTGEAPELLIHMDGVAGPLYVDELSSGTRQILLFAGLYVAPTPYQIILAEEADAGLHPARQAALVDLLHSLACRSTVLVTTHSPTFVARLSPAEEVKAISPSSSGPHITPLAEVISSEPWLKNFSDHGEAFARRGEGR